MWRRYRVTDSSNEKKRSKSKPKTRRSRTTHDKELQRKLKATEEAAKELEARIEALEEQNNDLQDDNLRLLAEMENTRKRTERRMQNERRAILVEFVKPLLDVADNIERAVQSSEENHDPGAILEGVKMVQQHLAQVFAQYGITPIETAGEIFDYNVHEALGHAPSDEHAENEIVTEVSRGYLLNGELLRPSRVIIARSPTTEEAS
jgi:molecular chaperone GrpE